MHSGTTQSNTALDEVSLSPVTSCGDAARETSDDEDKDSAHHVTCDLSNLAAASCGAPETYIEFFIGDHVRLNGLTSQELNGRVGTITTYSTSNGRYGVLIRGAGCSKALKIQNLEKYSPKNSDTCEACGDTCNLFAFAPCSLLRFQS